MRSLILLLAVTLLAPLRAADNFEDLWTQSIVTIEVTRKQFDYLQPWTRKVDQLQKMGTIIGKDEILTTADHLADHTFIRIQKGRGRWYRGEVAWRDYHANLAIIRCPEESFWKGTQAVQLAETAPRRGTVQLVRWRNGILEFRNVEVNRLIVKKGKNTFIDHLQLELDSEMPGIGWSEAIVSGDKLFAITTSKDDRTISSLPAPFIRNCLEDRRDGSYQGLGYFSFVWQQAENPDTLAYLGQEGEPRGVIVIEVKTNKTASALLPRDIILNIEGFDIDVQGDYLDPEYGNLLLENLATRQKRAGDSVAIKVIRDGKEMDLSYELPKVEYKTELVPLAVNDHDPEYVMLAGLLFQPLTIPYLQSWGSDWSRKAPFRLVYATTESVTPEKPSYVVLSLVMPDPINIGYQESRYLIVDKLNGKSVRTLQDLLLAKESPQGGFHLFEFRQGDSLQRLVLDAAEANAATARVLERYGIEKDRSIAEPAAPGRLARE